jgi:hypothetical protein
MGDRFFKANKHLNVHMTLTSFTKFLSFICDSLLVDSDMASLRGGEIVPEIQLYCTLWYIAGGLYSDIQFFTGISSASFYRVVWRTIRAIVQCKQLSIRFPKTAEEANAAADSFASVSNQQCIFNCVAAVDSYLLPPKKDANNVLSFFSVHYQSNSVNVQGACDHLCRFLYLADFGLSFCQWFLACRHRLATVRHIINVHFQLYVRSDVSIANQKIGKNRLSIRTGLMFGCVMPCMITHVVGEEIVLCIWYRLRVLVCWSHATVINTCLDNST